MLVSVSYTHYNKCNYLYKTLFMTLYILSDISIDIWYKCVYNMYNYDAYCMYNII